MSRTSIPQTVASPVEGYDLIVVGAGIFGLTIAEHAANLMGKRVCVIERRWHIGGNCFSEIDPDSGIEYHTYGSHLFHTDNEQVWDYLRRFTTFTSYRHRVLTLHNGQAYQMPINLATICSFFGRYFTPGEARELIQRQIDAEAISVPENLEEKSLSLIGRPLYEAFIKHYTKKQWQTDLTKLPPDIIARLPVRFNFDPYYFSNRHEGLPTDGYRAIFPKMVASPLIDVRLDTDFHDLRRQVQPGQVVVYTGPIDRYFDCRLGELGWRTLDLERETLDTDDFQGTSVMNYADEQVPFTRIHEYKHLHPERTHKSGKTVICREYSRSAGRGDEPYYPIHTAADKKLYEAYRTLAAREPNVIFGGRLGCYTYIDMDKAVAAAIGAFCTEVAPRLADSRPRARAA